MGRGNRSESERTGGEFGDRDVENGSAVGPAERDGRDLIGNAVVKQ